MNSTAPAYKVFCLALVTDTPQDTPPGLEGVGVGSDGVPCVEAGASESELQLVYEGWLARHGFVAKVRRCRPVIIKVGTKGFLATECPRMLSGVKSSDVSSLGSPAIHDSSADVQQGTGLNAGGQDDEVDGAMWLQHEVVFKGLAQQTPGME